MEDEKTKDDLRVCRKCGEPKDLSQFGVNRRTQDGIQNFCKTCVQAKSKRQYYNANADRPRRAPKLSDEELSRRNAARAKRWREEKGEVLNEEQRAYYESHKEEVKASQQRYYLRNKEYFRDRNKEWREAHKEERRQKNAEWRAAHPGYRSPGTQGKTLEGIDPALKRNMQCSPTERKKRYAKAAAKSDPATHLGGVLRVRINHALRSGKKAGSAVRDLGCTVEELKTYLESKFRPHPETGELMTWQNHTTDGWHIDHIVPLSSFDLTDSEQFRKACHYTNLQPLWWYENLQKSTKVEAA
jgi:hypothetical protein